eukprot:4831358-Prymnesium_polylepis.1
MQLLGAPLALLGAPLRRLHLESRVGSRGLQLPVKMQRRFTRVRLLSTLRRWRGREHLGWRAERLDQLQIFRWPAHEALELVEPDVDLDLQLPISLALGLVDPLQLSLQVELSLQLSSLHACAGPLVLGVHTNGVNVVAHLLRLLGQALADRLGQRLLHDHGRAPQVGHDPRQKAEGRLAGQRRLPAACKRCDRV